MECGAMQEFLIEYLPTIGAKVLQDDTGNIYATKGSDKTFPCLAAHMDTVHKITKGGIHPVEIDGLITGINPLTMEQTGIGGDDKCGIYAALHCLSGLKSAKAVFFVDEEIGCVGSSACHIPFFDDCRFVLQADRRGNSDWVTDIGGPLGSPEFQKAVSKFLKNWGYKPTHGMMTDVQALRDSGIGISVANMSAGYYNPHQDSEFISIWDLENVSEMMLDICASLKDRYEFKHVPIARNWTRRSLLEDDLPIDHKGDTIADWYQNGDGIYHNCVGCYETFPECDLEEVGAGGEKLCFACAWMAK